MEERIMEKVPDDLEVFFQTNPEVTNFLEWYSSIITLHDIS